MNLSKKIVLTVLVLGLISAGGYFLSQSRAQNPEATSFEACVAAGNPVMESYPRQCRSAEGVLFVEKINDGLEPVAESWGSISGTVLLGPMCPVMRDPPEDQCADKPYQTRLVLTSADGSRVIKEFSSKSDGTFLIDVLPGEYGIRSVAAANMLPYCASSEIIRVRINDTATTSVSCDTGIR
ncbi:hypothetical protein H7X87_02710 [Acetobacteraceae bacterium]|nr:hypothetical protein [Candidatus Parcubacteria bacterium]